MGLAFGFRFWVQVQCVRPCQRDQHALTQVYHPCHLTNFTVAIGKGRAACAQSFAPWQQATIEFTSRDHSVIACSRHIYIIVIRAHLVCGESHNQRNATGEAATTSPPFYNESHLSHVLLCEGWTRHDLHILVTAPFYCDRKRPSGMCAKLCTVAASNKSSSAAITLLLLVRATYIYCCSSHTSRLWWITQSTQRHQRGCNTSNWVHLMANNFSSAFAPDGKKNTALWNFAMPKGCGYFTSWGCVYFASPCYFASWGKIKCMVL